MSFDSSSTSNNLAAVASITRESSWIFAEEESAFVIRNVQAYNRNFVATTTTSDNVTTGRFGAYQGYSDSKIVPTFVEIVEEKQPAEYVQDFVDLYMHMTDYTTSLGYCNDGQHAYYLTAKAGYNTMIRPYEDRASLFASNATFAAAKARYQRWAEFNNDAAPYDGNNTVVSKIDPLKASVLDDVVSGNNTALIIVVISAVGLTAMGGYFLFKKKKQY